MKEILKTFEGTIRAIKADEYDKEDILTDLENILSDLIEVELRKRFEGYSDEELQCLNGENEETMKFWNRESAIDEAVHTATEEYLEFIEE